MRLEDYRIELRPLSEEDGGGFVATIAELQGCMGDGASYEDAVRDLRDAFNAWISAATAKGQDIPKPGQSKPVAALVRFPKSLHAELTREAEIEGVSFNSFVVGSLHACMASRRTVATGTNSQRRLTDHLVAVGESKMDMVVVGMSLASVHKVHGVMVSEVSHDAFGITSGATH